MQFRILRSVRREHQLTTLDFGRADFGLFRYLLGRVPWDRVMEGRWVQESWVIFKDHPLLSAGEMHPNKEEVRGKHQEASMDEQAVPGQTQAEKKRPTERGREDR